METTTLILNNRKYRYRIHANQNSDQYGIFLMGALQDIESVDYFSRYFSSYVNCITIEVPGTGQTDALPATFSIHDQTKMLLDFIEFFEIKNAHIFAFSYATAIAVELCKLWKGVSSLSICGGIPGIPSTGRKTTIDILGHAFSDRSLFADTFINSLTVSNDEIPRNKVIARSAKQKVLKYSKEQIQSFCENTLRLLVHKPSFDISNITVPSLLCIGEHDPYVEKKIAIDFSDKLSNNRFVSIQKADHLVHIQHPEKVAKAMSFHANNLTANINQLIEYSS